MSILGQAFTTEDTHECIYMHIIIKRLFLPQKNIPLILILDSILSTQGILINLFSLLITITDSMGTKKKDKPNTASGGQILFANSALIQQSLYVPSCKSNIWWFKYS